ncbi:MAG: hypothetical protein ACI805_000187, partial [Candidatus Azotimanducaceae bacterium]
MQQLAWHVRYYSQSLVAVRHKIRGRNETTSRPIHSFR